MIRKFIVALFVLCSIVARAQVQLQTGAAQASFPLFNYSDPKSGLSTSITLQYVSGNGIKVNDLSGNVGLGWALGAGGFIQRIQNGEPDDQDSRSLFPPSNICGNLSGYFNWSNAIALGGANHANYVDNYFPNGYLFTEFPVTNGFNGCNGIPASMAITPRFLPSQNKKWKLSRAALADRMQDAFIFNFNGRAGTFYIGRDGSFLVLPDSRLKIEMIQSDMMSQNIRTKISEFVITDELGIKYRFNALELSEVLKAKLISSQTTGNIKTQISNAESTGKYIVQKWLLTEIVNPRTNEKILFQYQNEAVDFVNSMDVSFTSIDAGSNGLSIFEQRLVATTKRLASINTPDGSRLEFKYDETNRLDEGGQNTKPLNSIVQFKNFQQLKSWKFSYKYFFKKELLPYYSVVFSDDDKRFLRLCLSSIQEFGNDGLVKTPPITFDYYTGSESSDPRLIVPPVRSFAQDHWGYYTVASPTDLNLTKYPDAAIIRDEMLVTNTYRKPSEGYAKLGMLRKITYPTGGTLVFELEQNQSISGISGAFGTTGCIGGVRVSKTIESTGTNTSNDIISEFTYTNDNGESTGWGFETPVYSVGKVMKYYLQDGNYTEVGDNVSEYSASRFSDVVHTGSFKLGTLFFNAVIQAALGNPTGIIKFGIALIWKALFPGPASKDYNTIYYNFYPLNYVNPIQFQYSKVTVKNIGSGVNNGRIVTEFSSPSYYNLTIPAISFPYAPKMRYAPWKFGLPVKTTYYNNSNSKVMDEENFYNNGLMDVSFINSNHVSYKLDVNVLQSYAWPSNVTDNSFITQESYYPVRGRVELSQKRVKSYNNNGTGYSEVVTNFTYNPVNYLLKEISTQTSKGEIKGEKLYYPEDYNVAGVIQTMRTQNIINVPICKVSWKQDNVSAQKKTIAATVNEFGILSNGDIRQIKNYVSELNEPLVTDITNDAIVQNNLLNYSFLRLQSTINYSGSGNPTEIFAVGNTKASVIYDYNNRLPVAEITNAKAYTEAAFTSFEADGTGGWSIIPGSNVINNANSVTGQKSFSGTLTKSVTAGKKYKVTLWSIYYANVTVNGLAGTALKTIGEWRLYEWTLDNITSVTVSGSNIDEVRLYPADAQINTATYNSRSQKTSECDTNNRIIYYEYDNLGRLLIVRDQNKNIIKTYEYNYKN
jgi:hypothetical protein